MDLDVYGRCKKAFVEENIETVCGVAGIINLDRRAVDSTRLQRMSASMLHRGPDDEGYILIEQKTGNFRRYHGDVTCSEKKKEFRHIRDGKAFESANIGLAHRRFSIIDLSAGAHQPFFLSDNSCCIVFNGEIYNYVEIRNELTSQGITFRTRSDTEVLLKAYQVWGEECFGKFNGFWALAIYDFIKKRMILSRDRLGKKPLFYTRTGSSIYFSSEIKGILAISNIDNSKRVNERAVFHWLVSGRKDLFNETFYEGIFMLPAGSWTVVDNKFPGDVHRFWRLPEQRLTEKDISVQSAARMIRSLLDDSVRIRLRADVPTCVELSGGMDSSSLVALASSSHREKISTFTVRFQEKMWNEEPFAKEVARRFNVDYHVMDNPVDHFWSHILAFTYLEEEPYHAPNLQTNQEIWQQMRSMGMKVSLNGAGGDEVFAGYSNYISSALLENIMQGNFRHCLNNLIKHSETSSPAHTLIAVSRYLVGSVLDSFSPRWRQTWRTGGSPYSLPGASRDVRRGMMLSSILYADMTHTLMPYWLCSGDRGYMGVPIEVRAPFLDYRLVEYVYRLPVTYLIRDGWHKWILRKAMESILPPKVVWRKRKLGFPFPYERFFSDHQEIIQYIFDNSHNPYIDLRRRDVLSSNWRAISFILWYELFFNENVKLFKDIEQMVMRKTAKESAAYHPAYYKTSQKVFA